MYSIVRLVQGDLDMDEVNALTVVDVAQMLRVCTKTVYRIIRDGNLKVIRVRGQIRITSSALKEFMEREN